MTVRTLLALAAALLSPAVLAQPAPLRFLELVERPVVDASGAKVADMYDVVVDTTEARVAYLVVTVGMRVVPVSLPSEIAIQGDKVVLALPRARLEAKTALDMAALGPNYKRGKDVVGGDLKDEKGTDVGDVKDFMVNPDGTIANVVVEFDAKSGVDKKGWIALPRASVRPEGRDFVATFNLDVMRPASEAAAENRRIEAANAAALSVDRDERTSLLVARRLVDAQDKPLAEITDFVIDGDRLTHLIVRVVPGGSQAALALPVAGMTRKGETLVLPAGAQLGAVPGSGRRASDMLAKKLVDYRGKEVGRLRELVVNLAQGKSRYAIAEFDPSWVAAGNIVTVRVPKDDMKVELNALMGAMIFDQKAWPDINHPQFISNINAYLTRQ